MKKKTIFYVIVSILLFQSCSVPDQDSSKVYLYLYFRLAKQIERRVLYNTEESEYKIPSYISVENRIKSEYGEFKPVSRSKYYLKFSNPFEFYIDVSLLDHTIKEIEILNCKLYLKDIEYDLFDNAEENTKLYRYKDSHIELDYKRNFNNGHKFVLTNNENYYSEFSLAFKKLPFYYNTNEQIKILYDMVITDESNRIIEYKANLLFNRSIVEKKVKNDVITWNEINIEEWNNNK